MLTRKLLFVGTLFWAFTVEALGTFEVPITLPDCDPQNPAVAFISSNSDWDRINDPSKRVFCVEPGNYTAKGKIVLTASGASGNERYILYRDPARPNDDTHPVDMASANRVVVARIDIDGGDYWVIDRIAVDARFGGSSFKNNAQHNILNRMLIENANGGLLFIRASNNTVQNSVLRKIAPAPRKDRHCILTEGQLSNIRIVNNEIYDCAADGVQSVGQIEGGIIANNDIYLTSALYSDCNGNLNTSGDCACAENAIDIKSVTDSVSPPQSKWLMIIGNRMWGFRRTDKACGGTGDAGHVIVTHNAEADYTLILNNIIMNAPRGFTVANTGPDHVSVIGNIFYKIHDRFSGTGKAIVANNGKRHEYYFNTIIDTDQYLAAGGTDNDFRCNVIINGGVPTGWWGTGGESDYNAYYNTSEHSNPGSNDIIHLDVAAAQHTEYCFTRKRLTGPETYCIPNARPARSSPHYLGCDPRIGSKFDIGVNDEQF